MDSGSMKDVPLVSGMLHACLYTRILTRTAKENAILLVYIDVRPVRIAFLWRKIGQKSYNSCPYIDAQTRVIAFCGAKPRQLSRQEVKAFLNGLQENQNRPQKATTAVPLEPINQLQVNLAYMKVFGGRPCW